MKRWQKALVGHCGLLQVPNIVAMSDRALVVGDRVVDIGQNHAQVMANWPDQLLMLDASLLLIAHAIRFVRGTIGCRLTIFKLVRPHSSTEAGTEIL